MTMKEQRRAVLRLVLVPGRCSHDPNIVANHLFRLTRGGRPEPTNLLAHSEFRG